MLGHTARVLVDASLPPARTCPDYHRQEGPRSGNLGGGRGVLEMWSGSRLSLAISSIDYLERVSLLQWEIYGLWQETQYLLILSAGRPRSLLDLILSLTVVQVLPYW
jgi:hypothetical protein